MRTQQRLRHVLHDVRDVDGNVVAEEVELGTSNGVLLDKTFRGPERTSLEGGWELHRVRVFLLDEMKTWDDLELRAAVDSLVGPWEVKGRLRSASLDGSLKLAGTGVYVDPVVVEGLSCLVVETQLRPTLDSAEAEARSILTVPENSSVRLVRERLG